MRKPLRNPDEEMRRLQRKAASGDPQAIEKLKALRISNGCDNDRYAITYTSMGDVFRVYWPEGVTNYDKIIALDLDCCDSIDLYQKLKGMHWDTLVRILKPFWIKDGFLTQVLYWFSSDMLDRQYRAIQALNNTIDFLTELGIEDVDQTYWDKHPMTGPLRRNPTVPYGQASHGICPSCYTEVKGAPPSPELMAKQRESQIRNGMTIYCSWCKNLIYDPEENDV